MKQLSPMPCAVTVGSALDTSCVGFTIGPSSAASCGSAAAAAAIIAIIDRLTADRMRGAPVTDGPLRGRFHIKRALGDFSLAEGVGLIAG